MWKYIITGSIALFLFASYLFYKNHTALTSSSGEVAAVQTQFQQAIEKNRNVFQDMAIKKYAEMRTAWLEDQKRKAEEEKVELENKIVEVKDEIAALTAEYQQIEGDLKRLREELRNVLVGVATVVGLDPDNVDQEEVASKVSDLMNENIELEKEIAQEEARIAALGQESERLNALITAARKLNLDRQSRISPAELSCKVLSSDPQWDFIILDAGVNKGIVIGSRLAVTRGEKKICELNVTNVEATRTTCEIVYSTLLPGERVEVNDKVTAVRNNK